MNNCKFCGQERKNHNSLINHERLCKLNPNKQSTPFQSIEFRLRKKGNGCNQYTKAKRLGLSIPRLSIESRRKISIAASNRHKNAPVEIQEEENNRRKNKIREKVRNGEWHTSLAKRMHYRYNEIDLHGKWELAYAKWLDLNSIKWERCKEQFSYIFEDKPRKYTPDFYLPESDEYIEIKGYKTKKDEAKWNQFPKHRKLKILLEKDLKDMNVI